MLYTLLLAKCTCSSYIIANYGSLLDCVMKYYVTPDTTVQWCQRNFLLAFQQDCSKCHTDCNLVTRDGIDGYAWRCRWKGCQAVSSIWKGNFLREVILCLGRSYKLYIGGLVIYLSNKYHMKQLLQSIP